MSNTAQKSNANMSLQERASYSGYTIPAWSAVPTVDYGLDVVKKGCFIESIDIHQQPFYLVGRNADVCDIIPEHPSLSRIHAVIQHGEEGRLEILDFKSTHGTFLNGKQIKAFTFTPLFVGDYLQFGGSMRMYTLTGPSERMRMEEEIKLEKQEKQEKQEKPKVHVNKLNILYLGEKTSNKPIDSEFLQRSRLDDDEGVEDEVNYSILDNEVNKNDLTESEKGQLKRITELRSKRDRMEANKNWKNKNENREETLQKLSNEIEELEQTLYDNIERRRYKENRKRGLRERQLDEEDSYFDRTNKKKKETKRVESREILCEKLTYKKKMLAYYESQLANMEATVVEEKQSEDSLDQFMNDNDKKMREMKEEMIRQKLQETRNDISDITMKIAKLPPKETPVLRVQKEEKKSERDSSTFKVVDANTPSNRKPSNSKLVASFGSIMSQLTAGKNHSFDDVEPKKSVSVPAPVSMNVPKAPRGSEKKKVQNQDVEESTPIIDEKPRDMSEYYVPKDMGVAVNKEALEDVKKEMGKHQPAFIKRIFNELEKQ